MTSRDKSDDARETTTDRPRVPTRTGAQRLKRVAAVAIPALNEVRARVADLNARVDIKLADVPEDRLQPAPATIAAPAALHYALLGNGVEVAELRDMFENLLAMSMDQDTAARAHPAFVWMIQQLTTTEARMLLSLTSELRVPIIDVRFPMVSTSNTERVLGGGKYLSVGFVCDFGWHIGQDRFRQGTSLSNLERLGIINIKFSATINDESGEIYRPLVERMRSEFPNPPPGAGPAEPYKGIVEFSEIGRNFWATCVRARR